MSQVLGSGDSLSLWEKTAVPVLTPPGPGLSPVVSSERRSVPGLETGGPTLHLPEEHGMGNRLRPGSKLWAYYFRGPTEGDGNPPVEGLPQLLLQSYVVSDFLPSYL